ncbi:MAG: hypothetical protein K6A38_04120 [Lachnospiraceae bacterium]|nr:hypothetical protein [Lachnospiraceae bacterium]
MMAASYFICLTKSYKRIKKKYLIVAVAFTVIFFALYIIFYVNPSDNLKIFGILFLTVPMLFNISGIAA